MRPGYLKSIFRYQRHLEMVCVHLGMDSGYMGMDSRYMGMDFGYLEITLDTWR